MRDAIIACVFAVLLIVFTFGVTSKHDRDTVMTNCTELGNSVSQCERLFE